MGFTGLVRMLPMKFEKIKTTVYTATMKHQFHAASSAKK